MKLSICMLKITSLMIVMINLSNCSTETPSYIGHSCENETSIISSSAYGDNLANLLTTLISSASTTGFYKDIVGKNPNDTIYGLFLCRGDISLQVCSHCVGLTAVEALFLCPAEKQAVVWFDMCMLRYSDHPFFSRVADWPVLIIEDITSRGTHVDPTLFNHVLINSMKELADDVVADRNFFATKESNIKVGSTLYSLGQCTKDLSPADCSWCLQAAVEQVVATQFQAGRFLFPSCNIVYGLSSFVEENSATTSPPPQRAAGRRELLSKIIIACIVAASVVVIFMSFWFGRKLLKQHNNQPQENGEFEKAMESLKFDLRTIEIATSKFCDNNELGEGGFGVVYKGTLVNGQEIAVKRMSKNSGQGVQEFKNEVVLVAKLQHRNLVRLLGFCLEGEETILVYEYVPNKSLDYFLLETLKRDLLDWSRRCSIIAGIARGLLYLHEDSSPGIIHRDLKASNILLDSNLNPKISDFGLAKMFGGDDDQSHGNTKRIVGTYGYMAPEYAMKGRYSTKSDVFSFGILLLEIITGRSISLGFHVTTCAPTLLSYAWQLWGEGNGLELMDPSLKDSCNNPSEFLRYINIGLLCAEEDPNNRPTMSSVVQLLKTDDHMFSLSEPKQPATFTGRLTVQILDRSS